MMMSAMRRPGSSLSRKKNSPNPKRRSRRSSGSREEDAERDRVRAASRLADLNDAESGRTSRADPPQRASPRSASRERHPASPKHGVDVVDSGIDSGNGVAEPDNHTVMLRRNSSSDQMDAAEAGDRIASPRLSVPDKDDEETVTADTCVGGEDPSVTKQGPAVAVAVAVTVTDHSHVESSSTAPLRKRHHKSRRKREKQAKSGEDSSQSSAVASRNSHADSKSSDRDSSDDNYAATDEDNDKETSDDDASVRTPRVENPKAQTEEEVKEGKSSDLKPSADEKGADSSDDMGPSAQAKGKRLKLKARLEQAKQSLESPHINNVVDAFEMAEGPLISPPNSGLLQEFRVLFQRELTRLRTELDTFRSFCSQQMELEANRLSDEKNKHDAVSEDPEIHRRKEAELQNLAVKEEAVKKREDLLAERLDDLQEYEKEILEVENMLNQRQAICERRQNALLALDEELQSLREDIFDKKDNVKNESDTSVERARKNWDFVRRNLTDKQAMMEATIQRYRTQIAAANASMAGKDSLIAHLQKQIKEAQDGVKTKEKKLERLEDKLVMATEEIHRLSKNSSANTSAAGSTVDPHSRPQSRSGSVRPQSSMQRQRSESPTSALTEHRSLSRARSVPASGRRMSVHPDASLVPMAGRRMSTSSTAHHPDIATMITSKRKASLSGEPLSNGVHEPQNQVKRDSTGGVTTGGNSRPGSMRRRQAPMSRSQSIANSVANASVACTIL